MMLKTTLNLLVSVSLALTGCLVAIADTAPEDAKKYRTSVMQSLGGHVGAASMHVRGIVEDNGFLAAHAEGLANGAAELKYLFPEGSAVDESEALPAIWDQPEEFRKAMDTAVNATAAFKEAVSGGDKAAIGAAFRDVGAACKGCHDKFRLDSD
jgi:cytochrome c556